jgi:integrase
LRTADLHLQVLSRVLSYAVDPLGKIAGNPCDGIKRLYSSDRSEIIWTVSDIDQIKAGACPVEVIHAVDLAAHTGLRRADLLRLCWSHVGNDAITITTGKSRHRREVVIPLYDDLRAVLARIPKRSPRILTNSSHRPWSDGSFGSAFNRAKQAAGMADRDLHFHDLRGTAATRFYTANLPVRVIAENPRMDRGERREDHPSLRRPVGRHTRPDRADQRGQEVNECCKTGSKTGPRNVP